MIARELSKACSGYFQENLEKIEKCIEELNEDQIWLRPNPHSNSIGNQILHLCGNIRQYAISSLGKQPDNRERDLEFSTQKGYSKSELIQKLKVTVEEAIDVFDRLDEEELKKIRSVQAYKKSGVEVIVHVTEHFSYHTGQIIFWTKALRDIDLGFYYHIDLTQTPND